MLKLQYIKANKDIPRGVVTSTARRGTKWYEQVSVGEVVSAVVTETGEEICKAVIVCKERTDFRGVIENAGHNHVGHGYGTQYSRSALMKALTAAYGDLGDDDVFTVLHILPLEMGQ